MRVYKFLSKKWAMESLRKRQLKASRFSEVNDPFEFNCIDLPDPILRATWRGIFQPMDSSTGFVSFSKNWNNPVVWGHYADNHHGLALGFDIRDDPTRLMEIDYVEELLSLPSATEHQTAALNALLKKVPKTKFAHWKYEDEVRWLDSLGFFDGPDEKGKYFLPYSDHLKLREVIIGAKSQATSCEINEVLEGAEGVTITTARIAFRSFSVVTQHARSKQK
ncbi:DUF2971 domain-containing protein [Aliiroseovarius marinus]|uniref:DUF2971 domain-containing protein n=1 Tax=Aliiroseovarius marinus TaxID=2500159 RepID=UPI00105B3665|nr:DUF2971 domain-containing protein [Aliiroseovarius marinus]